MPLIKTISVTYGRKFNLGDYNSADISVTVWADVTDADDPTQATRALFEQAKSAVKEQALPLANKQTAQLREFIAGLPKEVQPKE